MIITTQMAHKLVPTEIMVVAITVTITCLMIASPDTTIMKIRRDKPTGHFKHPCNHHPNGCSIVSIMKQQRTWMCCMKVLEMHCNESVWYMSWLWADEIPPPKLALWLVEHFWSTRPATRIVFPQPKSCCCFHLCSWQTYKGSLLAPHNHLACCRHCGRSW